MGLSPGHVEPLIAPPAFAKPCRSCSPASIALIKLPQAGATTRSAQVGQCSPSFGTFYSVAHRSIYLNICANMYVHLDRIIIKREQADNAQQHQRSLPRTTYNWRNRPRRNTTETITSTVLCQHHAIPPPLLHHFRHRQSQYYPKSH